MSLLSKAMGNDKLLQGAFKIIVIYVSFKNMANNITSVIFEEYYLGGFN